MITFRHKRPCLNCGTNLRGRDVNRSDQSKVGVISCVCKAKYTDELVRAADRKVWNRVHRNREFTREDDGSLTLEAGHELFEAVR